MNTEDFKLINRLDGSLAFQLFPFESGTYFSQTQRHNYYSIILILHGKAKLQIDLDVSELIDKTIICISPYQPYSIEAINELSGIVLNFHPDFFCTYRHQNEIETEGVLFNNIFNPPFFSINDEAPLVTLMHQMMTELKQNKLAQHELLVSYLKILLISLIRIKSEGTTISTQDIDANNKPKTLQLLTDAIESYYKQKHTPKDYAALLNMTPNALSKLAKNYFGKTLSSLINQRIMVEAKRELYLTSKSVKEIAFMLGYQDEHYFSRFFKKQAGTSPQRYRNTVGFAKQES